MVSVEDEWERKLELPEHVDLLFVTFDSQKIGLEDIRKKIAKHGFEAAIR